MALTLGSRAKLNNGVEMPYFGLGVWRSDPGRATQDAVKWALSAGYRHIDTARIYNNERDVGIAIRDSGVPREQVFVTTKLWNEDHGYDQALRAFDRSMESLGLGYVDLYLLHWPVSGKRTESWRALEKLYRDGRCRAIGVSNYTIRHLEELLGHASVVPVVNQVEFHPFVFQKELWEYCRAHSIQLEAYSPLVKGKRLDDPRIAKVAARYGRTPAQVLLRWALEREIVVIPKSVRLERIEENAAVFDFALVPEDVAALDALHDGNRVAWDPSTME